MALGVCWYDLACFAMVAGMVLASSWVIWAHGREPKSGAADSKYESLLLMQSTDRVDEAASSACSSIEWSQLWMTRWPAVHPAWLLLLRAVAAASMIGVLCWDLRTYDWSIMLYYTEWAFSLVIFYFLIATVVSAHGCWTLLKHGTENSETNSDLEENIPGLLAYETNSKRKSINAKRYEPGMNDQKAGFWGYLMQIAYQTSAGSVLLTDIIFWGVLVPFLSIEHFNLDLLMGCMHTLNLGFLLLDTALNSLPFPWFRMAYFVLWSCIYVVFQWILHACGFSWWPYPFLELSTPWAPLWYLCLALIHIPCYVLYAIVVKIKHSLFPKSFRHAM